MTATSPAEQLPESTPKPRVRVRQSLSEGMAGHHNALGLLRLVLASLVIFSHAFPLGGWGSDPMPLIVRNQETIGGIAVVGFFAISGYLIAKSGAGSDIIQFLWRRVLRIFPAFWLVLAVGALVVGPLVWLMEGRPLAGYFTLGGGGPVSYIVANADLTMRAWGVHDLFATTTPYGEMTGSSVFNGSLWTLSYEWACYLVIALFLVIGALKYARWLVVLSALGMLAISLSNTFFPTLVPSYLPMFGDPFRVNLTYVFLVGASLGLYSKAIPLNNILGALSAVVVLLSLAFGGWVLIGYPAFAYLLLWSAAKLPRQVQWIGAKNDYSYGIYVYGFLVQQFTAYLGWHHWGYVPWVIATLLVTFGCAWVSWHGVEKRAMSLKDLGPGRGIRWWFRWPRERIARGKPADGPPAAGPAPARAD
ncbi:acyltransferase [Salinibacterium sp. SYSU T00001]|uniref:acyltransferase family protein n=1 Tax=Homoserinimonas sedimenticola TaxID=2986805 RepID=UPI002235A067|nr:acyltransferase [Salinibacterium sedimenticola]MCW4385026.1 acyltransferase [Salinibacterium sedimenticola]